MANDNEYLTFRIRAIAENLGAFRETAKASDDVNLKVAKGSKLAKDLTAKNKELTTATKNLATEQQKAGRLAESLTNTNKRLAAARDKEADAVGRVKVAEAKLDDIRSNTKAKTSQIAAAEERLATARRNSARAASDTQRIANQAATAEDRLATARRNAARAEQDAGKIETEFQKLAEKALPKRLRQSGEDSGRSWTQGFLSFFKGSEPADNFAKSGTIVGRTFGSGFGSGLEGILKTEAGPAVLAGLIALVAVAAPAIGAVLAGGIVTAFGAGLAALPVVFALKADAVKAKWQDTLAQIGADLRLLSTPFDAVMIHVADVFQHTVDRFNPTLQRIFSGLATPVSRFADQIGNALAQLIPALTPLSRAFEGVLQSLGPALVDMVHSLADGLIYLSDSVSRNPTGLPDLVKGIGDLTREILEILGILNDANGAFERLTGGTSLVTVVIQGLISALDAVAFPLVLLAEEITGVSGAINALQHSNEANGTSMSQAANHTVRLVQGMKRLDAAAKGVVPPLKDTHDIAVSNAKAAQQATKNFNDWISSLFALRDATVAMARANIGMKQALAAAAQSIKDNGHTLDTNTAKGQANYLALLDVSDAAKTQTEQMIRNKDSLVAVAATAEKSKANFIHLAEQMGLNKAAAKKMADQMIAIPNVSRRAVLTANTQDLVQKLGDAYSKLNNPNLTKERKAKVNADIAALTKKIAEAQAQIDALHGKTVPITYTVDGVNFTLNTKTPSSAGRATGGKIRGPGSGTSDTAGVFALSNDEYVVKASSARGYGDRAMNSVNNGTATIIPGMATGGKPKSSAINIHGYNVFKSDAQLRKVLGAALPAVSTPGSGSGVARWRSVALAALAAAHEPAVWISSLLARMQRESGGNPRAINLWDSNAKAGTPSIGLMQTIGPTFNAFAGAYRARGIYDPFANIYAAIRYTVARYGSGPAGWNRPGGYKNGGWLMPGQLAYNETRRPEAVFNQDQLSSMNRPIIVQLTLDSKVIHQSLLNLNRNKGYKGLGLGAGERG